MRSWYWENQEKDSEALSQQLIQEEYEMGVGYDPVQLKTTAAEDAQQTLNTHGDEQTHQVRDVEDRIQQLIAQRDSLRAARAKELSEEH